MTAKRSRSAGSAKLRAAVCRANRELAASGLVLGTFGNVSGVDRDAGVFVIKPSGVPYQALTPARMVAVSLETGRVLGGRLRPSSDAPTHLEIYRAFECGGVAHTHSEVATAFAQARLPIRCLGTTHADYFRGDVPVTRDLTREEVEGDYERHTGLAIVEAFRGPGRNPAETPAVLVASHGPFAWGRDALAAVEHAIVLEQLARMDRTARLLAPEAKPPAPFLVDRHYFRKHGKDAYYGQP
ncbi:MAG TPA: L-ribulose-5-phosphate 4-epimerase AraD [Gemmatimonadales bacterium]|nr:L-ribulose-5-phosphate 4-epimerase AraD [Gemmatimonadales bacterium]